MQKYWDACVKNNPTKVKVVAKDCEFHAHMLIDGKMWASNYPVNQLYHDFSANIAACTHVGMDHLKVQQTVQTAVVDVNYKDGMVLEIQPDANEIKTACRQATLIIQDTVWDGPKEFPLNFCSTHKLSQLNSVGSGHRPKIRLAQADKKENCGIQGDIDMEQTIDNKIDGLKKKVLGASPF